MSPYPYRIRLLIDGILIVVIFCAGALVSHHYFATPASAPVEKWMPAQSAPQVDAVPKQIITPPAVQVYTPAAKQKLQLPDEIQSDPNLYVLQSARLPADTHPATVTTIIDQQTGEVQTYVRREPLPWFALGQTGEVRIDYGIKPITGTVTRLSVREDVLQVKALHLGINASLDTDGEIFVGVGIGYRW